MAQSLGESKLSLAPNPQGRGREEGRRAGRTLSSCGKIAKEWKDLLGKWEELLLIIWLWFWMHLAPEVSGLLEYKCELGVWGLHM